MKEKFGTISDGDSKASATPTKGGTPAADGEEKKTKKTPTKKATANKKRKVDDEADVEEKQITVKDEDEEVRIPTLSFSCRKLSTDSDPVGRRVGLKTVKKEARSNISEEYEGMRLAAACFGAVTTTAWAASSCCSAYL